MSMIGIGLGGFMSGFQRGMEIRNDREDRKIRQDRIDRQKVLDARQDEEYNRAKSQRDAVDQVNKDAQTKFNTEVAAGRQSADNFDEFWNKYALPKLKQTYLAQGDMDNAKRVQEWGDSADTKAGAKLAMGAILKAQTGDYDGALNDAITAGRKTGYIAHGYEVLGHETISGPDGTPLGYRLKMKTPDGKEVDQDVQRADMPRLIATFLNPQAAWESQQAALAQKTKDANELKQYGQKKAIDKAYGTGDDNLRQKAVDAVIKEQNTAAGDLTRSEADRPQPWDQLSPQDQEAKIQQRIQLIRGNSQPGIGGAAPAAGAPVVIPGSAGMSATGPASGAAPVPHPKAIVDTITGKTVAPTAAAPAQDAGPAPSPQQQPAPMSRGDNVSYLLQSADQAVQQGENPDRIAMELRNNGISADQWPGSLRTALARQQQMNTSVAVGLGQ